MKKGTISLNDYLDRKYLEVDKCCTISVFTYIVMTVLALQYFEKTFLVTST